MKLDQDYQTEMANSSDREGGEFEAMPEGYYLCRVKSIKLSAKAGASGYKQWVIVWVVIEPKKWAKRTVWDRRSLSPAAAFKMRELFDALGFEYDSDSSELVGEKCVVQLVQVEIESGPKKGDMSEDVEELFSAEDQTYLNLVGS